LWELQPEGEQHNTPNNNESGTKGYILFDPNTKRLVISKDVIFEEYKKWDWDSKMCNSDKKQTDGFVVHYDSPAKITTTEEVKIVKFFQNQHQQGLTRLVRRLKRAKMSMWPPHLLHHLVLHQAKEMWQRLENLQGLQFQDHTSSEPWQTFLTQQKRCMTLGIVECVCWQLRNLIVYNKH
jgi:hypothetical protein